VVLALLLGTLLVLIRRFMANSQQKPARAVQVVTVIRPPPPPPEQPPPPPPPEKVQVPLPQNQPEPAHEDTPAPPPQQLGLDAAGGAGGDGFGLVARQGGSDLVGTGGAVFAWYTNKLKDALTDCLSADPRLRGKQYVTNVRLRLDSSGRVRDVAVMGTTGSGDVDGAISTDASSCQVSEGPPLELPQPLTLQVVSRSNR
jgi:protein TonB